ncbi:hypothetical protein NC652_029440 [Populus alba x Populus x berolinensis]|nr:hypothetical protein NC652_029440 [Populus alba x Populus x berolinensis]
MLCFLWGFSRFLPGFSFGFFSVLSLLFMLGLPFTVAGLFVLPPVLFLQDCIMHGYRQTTWSKIKFVADYPLP